MVDSSFPSIVSFPFNPIHPENAPFPIFTILDGITKSPLIPVHPENAPFPIFTILDGITNSPLIPVHPLNAYPPTVVIPAPNFTFVNDVQS